jgi:hypothetical protein
MHARDQRVAGDDELESRIDRQQRRVILEAEPALPGQRGEKPCDQVVFARMRHAASLA